MCVTLSLFASSIYGRFSISVSNFHSAPSLLDISELCIFGLSRAIFRLWILDHTMKAFIGLFMWATSLWDRVSWLGSIRIPNRYSLDMFHVRRRRSRTKIHNKHINIIICDKTAVMCKLVATTTTRSGRLYQTERKSLTKVREERKGGALGVLPTHQSLKRYFFKLRLFSPPIPRFLLTFPTCF